MEKIIATIVGIILVLGLIAYTILNQVAGVRDTGDKAAIEQQKISQMLQDTNIVTGNTVKNYAKQTGFSINVKNEGSTEITVRTEIEEQVKDGALYKMEKTWDANGELSEIKFTQINLGNASDSS